MCKRESLNGSGQSAKFKLRVSKKFREIAVEVCFTSSIFVFLLFTLFRVKHNGINDFCKVSVSLALNAVFF